MSATQDVQLFVSKMKRDSETAEMILARIKEVRKYKAGWSRKCL